MIRIAYLVLFSFAAAAYAAEPNQPSPVSAAPVIQHSGITAAQARQDLDFLQRSLQSAHYDLYVNTPRQQYDAAFRKVRAGLSGSMSSLELVRQFQPLVALGKIGHARIDFPVADYIAAARQGGTVLPFDIRVEGKRVFVTHSYLAHSSIVPGAEILSFGDLSAQQLIDQVARYVSAERPYMVHAQMERFFPRWLWLMRGDFTATDIRGIGKDKRAFITRVSGLPILEVESQKSAWTEALSTREVRMLEDRIAYLRPGPFYQEDSADAMDTSDFKTFIDKAFVDILDSGATRLLIDLRGNPGGDNSFSDLMVAWFATRPFRFSDDFSIKASPEVRQQFRQALASGRDTSGVIRRMSDLIDQRKNDERVRVDLEMILPKENRFAGKVYVLVDRHSYSNAASAAAMIQDYGFGKIIGEETADLPTSYASSAQFVLPNSGISVTYPKGYFVRPNKDKSLRGVVPDLPVSADVFGTGPDAVLQAAISLVKRDE